MLNNGVMTIKAPKPAESSDVKRSGTVRRAPTQDNKSSPHSVAKKQMSQLETSLRSSPTVSKASASDLASEALPMFDDDVSEDVAESEDGAGSDSDSNSGAGSEDGADSDNESDFGSGSNDGAPSETNSDGANAQSDNGLVAAGKKIAAESQKELLDLIKAVGSTLKEQTAVWDLGASVRLFVQKTISSDLKVVMASRMTKKCFGKRV